jgi:hypothetical protein
MYLSICLRLLDKFFELHLRFNTEESDLKKINGLVNFINSCGVQKNLTMQGLE